MKFLTEETPAKVLGLLSASLFSLMLVFAVSASDASFSGTPAPFPDPFGPQNVVAMLQSDPFGPTNVVAFLDNVSSSYANAVHVAITGPTKDSFAYMGNLYQGGADFIRNYTDVDYKIVAMAGLSDLTWVEPTPMAHPALHPHVAAAVPAPAFKAPSTETTGKVAVSSAAGGSGRVAGAFTMRTVSHASAVQAPSLNSDGLLCDGSCQ